MSNWISKILEEAEGIGPDDFFEPVTPLSPDDRQVGEAPLLARKLYTLATRKERIAKEAEIDKRFNQDENLRSSAADRRRHYHSQANIILHLFWGEVQESLGLWDKNSIGIRKGWVVTCADHKETP